MMEKEFSQEFQNELLDLFKMCLDHNTDGLTLTFEYPHAKLIVDMKFNGEKINNDTRS